MKAYKGQRKIIFPCGPLQQQEKDLGGEELKPRMQSLPASWVGEEAEIPPTETLRACPNTLTATFSEPNSAAEVLVLELRRLLFCCTDPTQSPYQDVAQVCCTLRFSIKHGSNFFSSDGLGPPSWKLLKAAMEVVKNA